MDFRRTVLVVLVGCGLVAGGLIGLGLVVVDPAAAATDAAVSPARSDETGRSCPATATGPAAPSSDADPSPTSTATAADAGGTEPRIVELYPNPAIRDNVGEYFVLETPPATRLADWTVTDGHTTASLPNETVSGRVAVSSDPNVTERLTDDPVIELEGHLRLAADGDTLELRNGTRTIDAVAYDRAPEAERWYRRDESDAIPLQRSGTDAVETAVGDWHPRDATCLSVSRAAVDEATAFVLPDAPEVPRQTLRGADERLLLAGYTVTSDEIASELVAAADRGVDVAVLFEASPVGGTPLATDAVLETLEAGDVDVRVVGGEGARYRYHHAKYAVADDRVLVTSENWKPSGVGGAGSRGWGVRLENERLAADLARVFRADHGGWDTESGAAYRATTRFVEDDDALPSPEYPTEHEPATVPVDAAELLVAPDNADRRLMELLGDADDEILVKQASIDADAAVLEAAIDAARREVSVRILLDSTWYHADENAALAQELEQLAADESLPLEVKLVDDTDRFEKIHAKGVVIDGEVAVVGSANWNRNAFGNNREVLLALHGEAVASYYATVFEDDWRADDGSERFPLGIGLSVVVALALAALVGRRYVRFGEPGVSQPPE